jgi:hypothetical protein
MNKVFLLFSCLIMVSGAAASAQEVTQSVSSVGYASTTFKTPSDTSTQIVSVQAPSIMTRFKDGTKVEMDSDKSVYVVFADGARVNAPDGMHTLADGRNITIKNGKIIP